MEGEKQGVVEKTRSEGLVDSNDHQREQAEISFINRVGWLALALLALSFAITIACVGFISWLWYSNVENAIWHRIMLNAWATRAVSLTSTALRWAIATQSALALAMLAAVALEGFEVPLTNVASVSLMRVSGGSLVSTLKDVCWPLLRSGAPGVFFRTILPILALLTTATLLQFTSTALLSDLHTGPIPGLSSHQNILIDWYWDGGAYNYIRPVSSTAVWAANTPAFWPAFAELSGEPFKKEGVVDTGMNVRAFIPYSAVETRQSLMSYNGKAFLFDSRVTCQRPVLEDLVIYTTSPDGIWGQTQQPALSGTVSPSTDTPRFNASAGPVPFDCPYGRVYPGKFSICELHNVRVRYPPGNPKDVYAGTLVSEFRQFPPLDMQSSSGAAYLIIVADNDEVSFSNGEWLSTQITVPGDGENPKDTDTHNVTATLCFSAIDGVRRNVEIYSSMNRTEPALSWDTEAQHYNWTSVWNQLLTGSKNPLSPEERGVLRLKPPVDTWVQDESIVAGYDGPITNQISGGIAQRVRPYIADNMHLQRPGSYPYGNYSVILDELAYGWIENYGGWDQALSRRWVVDLFERMVLGNGTVADALHMLLFSLAAVAYYDQLPQYDLSADVDVVPFVTVLHPGGPLGTTRTDLPIGFTVVMVVLALHLLMFFYVCWLFAIRSKFSKLGDTWTAIGTIVDAATEGIIDSAKRVSAKKGAAMETPGGGVRVGLVVVDGQVHLKNV
ncbi:hypothetical protein H072_1488 [Dactylellina haptotyla CBS 200.50]|uniref:Uncharacterized protein n=1 Tax=Dactylellina haptotyla (strain CBS 200.50) TaxID=1284197 RepID=S8ANU4_DACHA|nr:hypothetical protein H072_1488 [Dactylellina haptotyla CBS 200.50]